MYYLDRISLLINERYENIKHNNVKNTIRINSSAVGGIPMAMGPVPINRKLKVKNMTLITVYLLGSFFAGAACWGKISPRKIRITTNCTKVYEFLFVEICAICGNIKL